MSHKVLTETVHVAVARLGTIAAHLTKQDFQNLSDFTDRTYCHKGGLTVLWTVGRVYQGYRPMSPR